jgi:hypothetical protein
MIRSRSSASSRWPSCKALVAVLVMELVLELVVPMLRGRGGVENKQGASTISVRACDDHSP